MNPTLLGNIFKLLAHFAKSTVLLERLETFTVVKPLLEIASLTIGISELSILNIGVRPGQVINSVWWSFNQPNPKINHI